MSIANYTDLQTAVEDWMHRSDLSAKVPDFIQQGESWLNRKLRTMDMEERASATMGTTDRFDALPSRFLEMQSLYYTNPVDELTFVEPSALIPHILITSGKPVYYTIKDGLEWSCVPASAYDYEVHYFKAMAIASDATNWLLTNHPDIYLYASIVSASIYLINDDRIPMIKSLLKEAVDDLNEQDSRKRGSQMVQMRTEFINPGFNIITG